MEKQLKQIKVILIIAVVSLWVNIAQNYDFYNFTWYDQPTVQEVEVVNNLGVHVLNTIEAEVINTVDVTSNDLGVIDVDIIRVAGYSTHHYGVPVNINR
jgi:hypothetical protein